MMQWEMTFVGNRCSSRAQEQGVLCLVHVSIICMPPNKVVAKQFGVTSSNYHLRTLLE